jgi:hypothetical protein
LHVDFHSLSRIVKDAAAPFFQGARFLSARTFIIWDISGDCRFYYLGPQTDLKQCSTLDLKDSDVVLISDGEAAIYVPCIVVGPYSNYRTPYNFAKSKSSFEQTVMALTPMNRQNYQQNLIFFTRDEFSKVSIEIGSFWASVFGLNIPKKSCRTSTEHAFMNIILDIRVNIADMLLIENPSKPISKMMVLIKNCIAVGYQTGEIAIIPQSVILLEPESYWINSATHTLIGHSCPITAFFAPQCKTAGDQCYLLSGDKFGMVILWDLK